MKVERVSATPIERPQNAAEYVAAAKRTAKLCVELCNTDGLWLEDWTATPIKSSRHHIFRVFTYQGLVLGCDGVRPSEILTPWGIYSFCGSSAGELDIVNNPTFLDEVKLGEVTTYEQNDRTQFYPILSVGNVQFPDPLLYRLTGPRAEFEILEQEWNELFAAA